jgi:hypothetical protein
MAGLAMEDVHLFGLFCCHLVYFVAVWYISWLFGIFLPVLVCCNKKNLATLTTIFVLKWRFS